MRAEALTSITSRRVHLVAGAAQAFPLASRSVDLVWASQVLHHVPDLDTSASEIRRILRPGGRLLVRATLDSAEWILAPFFPVMRDVASELPQLDDYIGVFGNAGLELLVHEQVQQVVAADG